MTANLGSTTLKRRRRSSDPMRTFDALPPVLRQWLSNAALPWSPASCRRIWRAARARGESEAELLARLDRAEQKMLGRDRVSRLSPVPGPANRT